MGKFQWYLNRLKAMNMPEVAWRIQQRLLQIQDRNKYDKRRVVVTSYVFDQRLEPLIFNSQSLGLNFKNTLFHQCTTIHLLGGYKYEAYKNCWNTGFQTNQEWGDDFSYSLSYKQRDELGDARSNWELNRHFQFVLLAKAFYATGDRVYADELEYLFNDWSKNNYFLHGISWTSVMEVAIRCIQWCVTLAFLRESGYTTSSNMLVEIEIGIKNMASYIVQRYSRFSSANNHLLVEATAIAYAGFSFGYNKWQQLAISILDEELMKQNYPDGVNKEMSLHYQTFGMEAYALVMHLMMRSGLKVSRTWMTMLTKQCEFVVHSMVSDTMACEFGDNDEGKILDLQGGEISHYKYLLQLCSLVLGKRFESFDNVSETICWLYDDSEIAYCKDLALYKAAESRTFVEGGYTFLRSIDRRIVIGIDHAPLGFGSIAAHGHADALSFQLYVDGKCILGDPGTFIYHCNLGKRNDYRRSLNHNTVWAQNGEQSQMMGAFLWGKKAETTILDESLSIEEDTLKIQCNWYNGEQHIRCISFDKKQYLVVDDVLQASSDGFATLILHPCCNVAVNNNIAIIESGGILVKIETNVNPSIQEAWYSKEYGNEEKTHKIVYCLKNNKLTTKIWIEKY